MMAGLAGARFLLVKLNVIADFARHGAPPFSSDIAAGRVTPFSSYSFYAFGQGRVTIGPCKARKSPGLRRRLTSPHI